MRTALVTLLALPLLACQSKPPVDAGDISQYYCPNGSLVRMSLSPDRQVMRISQGGHARSLRLDEKTGRWSNGKASAELQGDLLRLDSAGTLMGQNCRLQIPASNNSVKPQAAHMHITGTITYRQRIALSPQAEVIIRLLDVSKMDVAATVLAETRLKNPGQVPIAFSLPYDASKIEPRHSYTVQVRIEESGKLRFTTTTAYPVLASPEQGAMEILVDAVSN